MKRIYLILIISFANSGLVLGANSKTSAGLTLLEGTGARPSALGEAFAAGQDDIAGLGYNPASLASLKSSHFSFLFHRGLAEDSFGQFMVGRPSANGGFGLTAGYYDGGRTELFDGTTTRDVVIQKDMAVSLGGARKFNRFKIGLAAKDLSSELAQVEKATAFAGDMGIQYLATNRLNFGASFQNVGSKLQYIEEKEDLPRVARAGLSFQLLPSTLFLFDLHYLTVQEDINPAIGLESFIGPMALRAGYKAGSDLENFTFGTGFLLGNFAFDYSFGLVQDLDPRHKVSLSMRFATDKGPREIVQIKPSSTPRGDPAIQFTRPTIQNERGARIYQVKEGDTLGSIAEQVYGDRREWRRIYTLNIDSLGQTQQLVVGQKIRLP